jgi:hypothetical protein
MKVVAQSFSGEVVSGVVSAVKLDRGLLPVLSINGKEANPLAIMEVAPR